MDPFVQSIIAAIVSFTLVWALIYLLCQPRKSSSKAHTPAPVYRNEITLSHSALDYESITFDASLERISIDVLKQATRAFSSDLIVGDGSFGLVYRATLPSSSITVAIKKLAPDAFQGYREFRAEMETLSKVKHKNIVKMLGYCISGSDRLLIYEYLENGSLDHWLHGLPSSAEEGWPLQWEVRCKVIKGVANGLQYLHGLDKPIIHRDIKASNVLLDLDFEAHLADFGFARALPESRSHVSTQVAGTMGYMPPEYREGVTTATVKADVYSFGILMLEVATGARPNLPVVFDGKDVGLIQWARKLLSVNRQMEMLDSAINRAGLNDDSVRNYFRIALTCTNETMRERPTATEVVNLFDRLPI